MAPKQKKPNNENEEGEEPFQAVILTDSFQDQFLPISHELPRCLMPLCNIPLIEYTLELLATVDIFEVLIVCTTHIDTIKTYFENSDWMKPNSRLSIKIVPTPDCMSVGDAIRELDARQLISSDFILTSGELISNIKLEKVLEEHRARKKTDKNSIMTMVLKEASRTHTARAKDANSVFVLDPITNQCVYYESVVSLPRKHRMEISPEIFENRPQIEFRNDLVDPYLDICSVEVPALFTENFDWQRLRADFVHGILTSDILGKTIYTDLVCEPYVAQVQNEQLYSTISNHMLNRWAFPIVPETNLKSGDDYEFARGNIYKSMNVVLSRSCIIDENVQIGSNTIIGENTRIGNSIIGNNCTIGDNVVLNGVFLWDNVTIGDNCTIEKSIIAHHAEILENTTVAQGSLISLNVTVGPNATIPKYSRLSLFPQPKNSAFAESSDEEEDEEERHQVLHGDHEPVYFWTIRSDDDEMDVRNMKLGSLAYDFADLVLKDGDITDSASEVGESDDDDDDIGSINGSWALETSMAKKTDEFKKEISQTIERSISENHTVYTAALEVTGLRMSSNGSYTDIREVMIPIIFDHIDHSNCVQSAKTVLTKWSPLIGKMTHSSEDQLHVLQILQRHSTLHDHLSKIFSIALQFLYNADVLEEEAIQKWFRSELSKSTPGEVKVRERAVKFIEWLEEAEEESEEDDEESDDE
ncbi:hypothetical protein BDF21DRAFT_357966 [Thamnidium elegans]|uniref:Translation initiation factor eIF2B subunit epsilon n=1 Tax=Thamnidium elegans TaxID=101142 RepID=A0A8H7VW64_9FUNG|nr:hypothetical protein INT48_001449 [Thamnidium elegans]KAI8088303.1 hypothetical protein BDF21DRAFT_357966 [Thamnidium elegans]